MNQNTGTVAFHTLGCKTNFYESEAMAGLFREAGYQQVEFETAADVYVVNTCTVTSLSDRKSRKMIRRAKRLNPCAIVAVVGCYAQVSPDEVAAMEGVDIILGTRDRGQIVEEVARFVRERQPVNLVRNIMEARHFEEMTVRTMTEHTRAFLKIQEGCSQFCAYCIIPYARGPVRSRQPEAVLEEVQRLVADGFDEFVLTGINLAAYGRDLPDMSLMMLLDKLHAVAGVERIRLGSVEPQLFTEAFTTCLAGWPRLCSHFHISLQSGSAAVLRRMNRHYLPEEYLDILERIRVHRPLAAITTDIMTGFPGETGEEAEETLEFVRRAAFARVHVFRYSQRKGTPAAEMEAQISPEVKEQRARALSELADSFSEAYLKQFEGQKLLVTLEIPQDSATGILEGVSSEFVRVAVPAGDFRPGDRVLVECLQAGCERISGRICGFASDLP